MSWITRSCGLLAGLIWLACAATGFFYVYMLLTFNIFASAPMLVNFRENRLAVIFSSLVSVAFLGGAIGVFSRRPWARGLSFFLCGLMCCIAAVEILQQDPGRMVSAVFAVLSLGILPWFFSPSGRTYFHLAAELE